MTVCRVCWLQILKQPVLTWNDGAVDADCPSEVRAVGEMWAHKGGVGEVWRSDRWVKCGFIKVGWVRCGGQIGG